MNHTMAAAKYPSEFRPQYIYTNSKGSHNFTVSYLDQPFAKDQIEPTTDEYISVIKRINPAYVLLSSSQIVQDDIKAGCFDYKCFALDTDLYNLICICTVNGRLLLSSFNCPFSEYRNWKKLFIQMMFTITISEKGKEEE